MSLRFRIALLVVALAASEQATAVVIYTQDFSTTPTNLSGSGWVSSFPGGATVLPGTWSTTTGAAVSNNEGSTEPGSPAIQANAQYSFTSTELQAFGSLFDPVTGYVGGGDVSGSLYVTFQIQAATAPANTSNFAGLQLHRGAATTRPELDAYPTNLALQMGKSWGSANFDTTIHGNSPATAASPLTPVDAAVHTFAARIDYTAHGPDVVTVYLDPNFSLSESAQPASAISTPPVSLGNLSFNNLALRVGNTNITYSFDNIKFGTRASDIGFAVDPLSATVNRETGEITLTNNQASGSISLAGYSVLSPIAALDPTAWNSFAPSNQWQELVASPTELSELTLSSVSIAAGQSISLGNDVWQRYVIEDVRFEALDANTGQVYRVPVEFSGNDGARFEFADLNFDGEISSADWLVFRAGQGVEMDGLPIPQSYALGDLDGDLDNDIADFRLFRDAFNDALGDGALAAVMSGQQVPEPSSVLMVLGMTAAIVACRTKRSDFTRRVTVATSNRFKGYCQSAILLLAMVSLLVGEARAVMLFSQDFNSMPNLSSTPNWTTNFTGGATPGLWDTSTGVAEGTNPVSGNQANAQYNFSAADKTAFGSFIGSNLVGGGTVSGTMYFAFDIRYLNPASHGASNFAGFQLRRGAVAANNRGGLDSYQVGGPLAVQIGNAWGGNPATPGVKFDVTQRGSVVTDLNPGVNLDNNWHTIVGRITYNASANDNMVIYMDPNFSLSEAEQSSAIVTTLPANDYSFDTFVMRIGNANVGINFDNILFTTEPTDVGFNTDPLLTLKVNTTTGGMWLENHSGRAVSTNYLSIESDLNGLNRAGYSGLAAVDGFPNGDDTGNGWELGGNPSNPTPSTLVESFLQGTSSIPNGASLFLGNAYNTTIGDENLRFVFNNSFVDFDYEGIVEYVTSPILEGDYNNDGVVNLADYTVWRDNLGSSTALPNDLTPGVDAGDYATWKTNFGASNPGSVVESAQVPEASSFALLLLALAAGAWARGSRRLGAMALSVMLAPFASADVTYDRQYFFGDPGKADAVLAPPAVITAATVAEGEPMGFEYGEVGEESILTGDETSPYRDLFVSGATYTSTTGRPQAGSGGFGANFDGAAVLYGEAVNLPQSIVNPGVTYTGITTRGLQFWAKPDAAQVGVSRQVLVADSIGAGGVAITASGKWTQVHAGHADDILPVATVDVEGGQWAHVMQHVYANGTAGAPKVVPRTGSSPLPFTGVVYVNGIAVSVNNDSNPASQATAGGRVGYLTVGAIEVAGSTASAPLFGDHFSGVIDDLSIYVYGDNTAQSGQDWGTFNLFKDNDWIAAQIETILGGGELQVGDINLDGSVGDEDVALFAANWRRQKAFFVGAHNQITAGDWETWGWGDLNVDGVVDFADWFLLRANHPDGPNLSLSAALAGTYTVPEPHSVALVGVALTLAYVVRRGRFVG